MLPELLPEVLPELLPEVLPEPPELLLPELFSELSVIACVLSGHLIILTG